MLLQLWTYSVENPVRFGASIAISVVTHATLIVLAVISTQPDPSTASAHENRVAYLPPPNPLVRHERFRETLRYIAIAPPVDDAMFGDHPIGANVPPAVSRAPTADTSANEAPTPEAGMAQGTADTFFTIIDVDTAAERLSNSDAPKYPPDLLVKGVEGATIVQFIVDTTGFADVSSFRVISASHSQFAQSVLLALPGMRFTPARIGTMKVRQLVELPFAFNIARPLVLEEQTAKDRRPQAKP